MRKNTSEIIRILSEMYPEAECSLDFESPFQLLIAVILSAQTTDKRVNMVTPALFGKYPTAAELAAADGTDVEKILHSLGFFRSKAANIIACAKAIRERFGGEVPDNMADLTSLAGVGRKTANIILGDVFGLPSYVCDTHVIRISGRLGWTNSKNPDIVERDLRAIIPLEHSTKMCHRIVHFGRDVCDARRPRCEICELQSYCEYYFERG
ncbi:MAG: endonuclease III [Oscillospiraceae bacterium]|nr:endonuclease III [Oscillospiraceae bacterium]